MEDGRMVVVEWDDPENPDVPPTMCLVPEDEFTDDEYEGENIADYLTTKHQWLVMDWREA